MVHMYYYPENDKKDLKKFVKRLIKDLKSDDPQMRRAAAHAFNFESVVSGYVDGKPVNKDRVDKFNEISREIAMDAVIEGLKDNNRIVQADLIHFLGTLKDKRALKRLQKLENDPDVKCPLIYTIFLLNDFSLDCLLKGFESDKIYIKTMSMWYLGEKHPKNALCPIIKSLNNSNWSVRFKAVEVLGNIGNKKALEPLLKCLNDKSTNVRRKSIQSIGKIITNEHPLTEEKSKETTEIKCYKVSPKVLNALINSLKDKNPNVRVTAVETLGKINNNNDEEKIKNSLKDIITDSNSKVSQKTKETLKKIEKKHKTRKVPEWNMYNPRLEYANDSQKKFYRKWLLNLNKGKFLDIEGNLSYVFNYLYGVINEFIQNRDINHFLDCFNKIEKGYGEYPKIKEYLIIWKSDAYRLVGEYDKALETIKEKGLLPFEATIFAQIISHEKGNFIDGKDLIYMNGISKLTDFGKKHQNEIADVATLFLNDFYKENGMNLAQFFLKSFNTDLSKEGLSSLEKFFPKKSEYLRFKGNGFSKENLANMDQYSHGFFRGCVLINIDANLIPNSINFKYSYVPPIVAQAFKNEIKRILRESENTVREEMDIPKIGEGWVSETELYYLIMKAFPKEHIIHHGRPSWLGQQHLDIYFPAKNIGIEYQGEQHNEPLDFFGGQKAFEYRQKLDKRKKERCKKNECKLIYIYPDYDFKEIKNQINEILNG
jgi:HEAT repeat protein